MSTALIAATKNFVFHWFKDLPCTGERVLCSLLANLQCSGQGWNVPCSYVVELEVFKFFDYQKIIDCILGVINGSGELYTFQHSAWLDSLGKTHKDISLSIGRRMIHIGSTLQMKMKIFSKGKLTCTSIKGENYSIM